MIKNKKVILVLFSLLALAVLALAPLIGMETISFNSILNPNLDNIKRDIFWRIRVPRVLIAFISGSALAISGMTFQSMFRNSLATPFTLGVSSGAAFGAALYVKVGILFSILGVAGQTVFAFLGALISIVIIYVLSKIKKGFSVGTMLLAGVAINFFFSSFILFIQFISDFTQSFSIMRWLMGGFEIVGYSDIYNILPFILVGSTIIIFLSTELNLLALGEDIAISRGVSLSKIKNILFFATSLMVSGVISVVGPIGFVGMMVPHISRLIIGADHRYLVFLNIIFGGAFLVLCDTLSRVLIAPVEIPVGVITALLGGPFFIWLLIKSSNNNQVI
ncbi:MAG: iron ABC transporter permease [Melioribacteraceae bacterium]|jgi:iron complex transport system permease protein|nr:iron ABC transporter permease [Melioribacteraceae bacterium]